MTNPSWRARPEETTLGDLLRQAMTDQVSARTMEILDRLLSDLDDDPRGKLQLVGIFGRPDLFRMLLSATELLASVLEFIQNETSHISTD
ncbi:MAG TPA: hypothetical protein VNL16_17815 [Chloroflexota bacterium]|nr:hypothetical protein [Chloroflexota bacterium]